MAVGALTSARHDCPIDLPEEVRVREAGVLLPGDTEALLEAIRGLVPTDWVPPSFEERHAELTKIEREIGGPASATNRRRTAGKALTLHPDILSNLGRMASQNDPDVGRKALGPEKALAANEKTWMRAAIVLIAEQIGAHNASVVPTPRSMADLPAIP